MLGLHVRGEVDRNQFIKHLRQIGLNEISPLKGGGNFVTKGCGNFVTSDSSAASGWIYASMKLLQINGA